MKVLIDTSVWSLALPRKSGAELAAVADELKRLIVDYRVAMIGVVRQEVLSGIRTLERYMELRDRLRAFPDLPLRTATTNSPRTTLTLAAAVASKALTPTPDLRGGCRA